MSEVLEARNGGMFVRWGGKPVTMRRLQSRTHTFWVAEISNLLPRQTVEVYRQGNSLSTTGKDSELVGVYDCTTEVDRLWCDVEWHATEALKAAA